MILSGKTLEKKLEQQELVIVPYDKKCIQPASIDLRISNHFLTIDENNSALISLNKEAIYRDIYVEKNGAIIISPQSFLLATTLEYVEIPSYLTAFVEGRSSIGRLGLFIQNAGWVDPGFKGHITLELFNANRFPIEIPVGRRVCQLVLAELDQEAERYDGKYIGQTNATASRVYLDYDRSK
ncbi:dCTP deaminase [Sutcliffiella halmapala]|uniref:dCTP deaminase n=1 Tax=Sutcliffiella halmapala TaxID=79882 RepID=UPI0009959477|nr:dCTP deaminase [Sutcliffiella halmapala]